MLRLRSKALGGIGVLAIAGALAATGLTAASASQAAGRSGTEYFQLVNATVANNAPSSIIARGVFTAGGVDHPGNTVDTVVFPDGTFKIAHSRASAPALQPRDVPGRHRPERHLPVGPGHTGAYAGIRGHGMALGSGPIGRIGEVCHQAVQPVNQSGLVVTGPGMVVAVLVAVGWRHRQRAWIRLRRHCGHSRHPLRPAVSQFYRRLFPVGLIRNRHQPRDAEQDKLGT